MNTNRLINPIANDRNPSLLGSSAGYAPSVSENAVRPSLVESPRKAGNRIRRILVPLDGSPFAEHAIPIALDIARQTDAILHLAHVVVPTEITGPFEALHSLDAAIKEHRSHKRRYLSDLSRLVTARVPLCVSSTVTNGVDVGETLYDACAATSDLVVMATHGRGPLGRFWWGSVAHSLLQRMTAPLILVPGNDEAADLVPRTIDDVILPIDGDTRSERVIEPLLELGLFVDARHTLLHVARPEPKLVVKGDALRTEWVPSYRREVAGREYLRPLAYKLRESGRDVRTQIFTSEKPAWQVVSRNARHCERELVACTYRQERLWKRLVWPSMAERLFRSIDRCPLMLVPS